MMGNVRQQLSAKGAGPDVQEYVEQLLLERHQSYSGHMTAEADKRRVLLDHVSKLEVVVGACIVLGHTSKSCCSAAAC